MSYQHAMRQPSLGFPSCIDWSDDALSDDDDVMLPAVALERMCTEERWPAYDAKVPGASVVPSLPSPGTRMMTMWPEPGTESGYGHSWGSVAHDGTLPDANSCSAMLLSSSPPVPKPQSQHSGRVSECSTASSDFSGCRTWSRHTTPPSPHVAGQSWSRNTTPPSLHAPAQQSQPVFSNCAFALSADSLPPFECGNATTPPTPKAPGQAFPPGVFTPTEAHHRQVSGPATTSMAVADQPSVEWGDTTTLMMRNLPNKYSQRTLLGDIKSTFHGTFDFFYLPLDHATGANKGYAFINFKEPVQAWMFKEYYEGRRMSRFNSEKTVSVSPATLQGFDANHAHYANSRVNRGDPSCRPLFLREPSCLPPVQPTDQGSTCRGRDKLQQAL